MAAVDVEKMKGYIYILTTTDAVHMFAQYCYKKLSRRTKKITDK